MNNHETIESSQKQTIKPQLSRQVDAKVRFQSRLLNIMVKKPDCNLESFDDHVISALREYADALEKSKNASPREVTDSDLGGIITSLKRVTAVK